MEEGRTIGHVQWSMGVVGGSLWSSEVEGLGHLRALRNAHQPSDGGGEEPRTTDDDGRTPSQRPALHRPPRTLHELVVTTFSSTLADRCHQAQRHHTSKPIPQRQNRHPLPASSNIGIPATTRDHLSATHVSTNSGALYSRYS